MGRSASAMNGELSVRDGNLDAGLARLQSQVRSNPSNATHRIFLFQLLAVLGQWDRALTQLNVAGELDAASLPMVQTYREALQCEVLSRRNFRGQALAARVRPAGELARAGDRGPAARRLKRIARSPAAPRSGVRRGARRRGACSTITPFEWIADADPRLGPMLEAIINGRYYWVPFSRIRAIAIRGAGGPARRRVDAGHFTWANGGAGRRAHPVALCRQAPATDSALRLARRTEWIEYGGVSSAASRHRRATDGQRMFDHRRANEYALLDVRSIESAKSRADRAWPTSPARTGCSRRCWTG